MFPQVLEQMDAILLTQAKIDDDHVMESRGKGRNRFIDACHRFGVPAKHSDTPGEDEALHRFVVNDQDSQRRRLVLSWS